MAHILESGVHAVTLLAISDQGQPSYNENLATKLNNMGMPCFGCVPDRLPDLLEAVLKGSDLGIFSDDVRLDKPPGRSAPGQHPDNQQWSRNKRPSYRRPLILYGGHGWT